MHLLVITFSATVIIVEMNMLRIIYYIANGIFSRHI